MDEKELNKALLALAKKHPEIMTEIVRIFKQDGAKGMHSMMDEYYDSYDND